MRRSPRRFIANLFQRNDMGLLGIERSGHVCRAYSRRLHGETVRRRQEAAAQHLELIAAEVDGHQVPEFQDGWVLDTSRSLPHLDEVISDMEEVIAERGLTEVPTHGKPFLRDIHPPDVLERYPSLLDFVSSPPVVAAVARYAGWVVPLSGSLPPPGVRLMESTTKFDPTPNGPFRSSQLWHRDYHSTPTIYVAVAVRDIGPDDGPLHFIGAEASQRVSAALRERPGRPPYRVPDAVVEELVGPDEIHRFSAPAGTVLFIDSSACFHYGSRKPANPRYQLQYSFINPIRNDLADIVQDHVPPPLEPDAPPLRRLALDRTAV